MSYRILQGDCLELMRELPDASVQCVLTDPPYNASVSGVSFAEKGYQSLNESWDRDFRAGEFLAAVWPKLALGGSLLAFCSFHTLADYLNWRKPQQILHWNKTNPFPAIAKVYTFAVEYIVWYTKNSPYTFNKNQARTDVFALPQTPNGERLGHPTQKPLQLMSWLVSVHTNPGDTVLDPFMGSGTTGEAALTLGRSFVGYELAPEYFAIAKRRLEAAEAQPRLLEFA